MIIDAHHHVWDLTVREQDWLADESMTPIRRNFSVDDLRPAAKAAGVTATVMVQTITVAGETPEMLATAAADPLVAGVVGWIDITSAAVADELAMLRAGVGGEYLVGIRHQVQSERDPDWLRRPDVIRGLRTVADAGLAYDLIVKPHQLSAATYAAGAVPDLRFVLDHAGKPAIADSGLNAWAGPLRELSGLPNVACKLSGLVTEAAPGARVADIAPYADVVLNAFGPDRLMFGSDWPVCLLVNDYGDVVHLALALVSGLSAHEQAAVFGATAARVYAIRAPRRAPS